MLGLPAAARRQEKLGWTSRLAFVEGELVLRLANRQGEPLSGARVMGVAKRPVHERDDSELKFRQLGSGEYRAKWPAKPGLWDIDVEVRAGNGERYRRRFRIEVKT